MVDEEVVGIGNTSSLGMSVTGRISAMGDIGSRRSDLFLAGSVP